jgi:hypothetical protein
MVRRETVNCHRLAWKKSESRPQREQREQRPVEKTG